MMEEMEKNWEKKFTWEEFKEDVLYDELIKFFQELEKDEIKCIIFVSRKAYCLFLLLKKMKVVSFEETTVYTDRLIMKNWEPEKYSGKNVLLIDDIITTGYNLTKICQEVIQKTDYSKIYLKTFLCDDEFNVKDYQQSLNEIQLNTGRNITFCVGKQVSASEKLRFSAMETLLFHQSGIPYCVDIPYLSEVKTMNGGKQISNEDEVLFTQEEYGLLQCETSKWKFIKCDQSAYLQNKVENAVIIMKESNFSKTLPEFVHEFVVRVQIVKKPEGMFGLIFSPFAILKSIKYEELENLFFYIYEDTDYAEIMRKEKQRLQDKFAEIYYKAIYRAVVYLYSCYIGYGFKDYLESITLKEYDFQNKNNVYCFQNEFIDSVKKIFRDGTSELFLKTFLYKGFTKVEKQWNVRNYITKYGRISNDYTELYYYLWILFNELRRTDEKQSPNEKEKTFLTIKELQEAISISSIEDGMNEDVKYAFTACLCAMLEQGKITNELVYDREEKIVYRGFKYGTNGEATFDLPEKIFYIAILKYKNKLSTEQYKENYDKFMMILKKLLIQKNLLGSVISSGIFQIYAEYYRKCNPEMLDKLEFLIENKEPTYVKQIGEYIDDLDF